MKAGPMPDTSPNPIPGKPPIDDGQRADGDLDEPSKNGETQEPPTGAIVAIILSVIQILGVSIAVLAATVEIESIVFSGPILSLTGLVLAAVRRRDANMARRLFGLSALPVSVACFLLIVFLKWSPKNAEQPITTILFLYEVQFLPIGLAGLFRIIASLSQPTDYHGPQFSLRSLFFIILSTAMALATARVAYYASDWNRSAIAAGICSLIPAFILCMCIVAHQQTHPGKTPA